MGVRQYEDHQPAGVARVQRERHEGAVRGRGVKGGGRLGTVGMSASVRTTNQQGSPVYSVSGTRGQ